jgi:hypothetical protein
MILAGSLTCGNDSVSCGACTYLGNWSDQLLNVDESGPKV